MDQYYSWRWLSLLVAITFLLLLLVIRSGHTHENYPHECCEDQHCHPVNCSEIKLDGQVYRWHEYSINKDKARNDIRGCHVCIYYGQMICIFVGGES